MLSTNRLTPFFLIEILIGLIFILKLLNDLKNLAGVSFSIVNPWFILIISSKDNEFLVTPAKVDLSTLSKFLLKYQ